MAHIESFRIEGLLGRKDPIEATLNRHVNIFFGENGCGKTTLLKILAAALDRNASAIAQLPVQSAEVVVYSAARKTPFTVKWERSSKKKPSARVDDLLFTKSSYIGDDSPNTILFRHEPSEWKVTGKGSDALAKGGWKFSFLQTHRLHANLPATDRAQESVFDKAFSDALNRQWLQYYNKTLADVRNVQEEGLRAVLRQVLSPNHGSSKHSGSELTHIHERVERFLSRQHYQDGLTLGSFKSFKERYERDDNVRRVVENLSSIELSIEEAVAPVNSFLRTLKMLIRDGKEISPIDTELKVKLQSGETISLAKLSSGEKHLLKILLSAMNTEENPFLVDEPELSMHIDWQRAFVQTVQSLNGGCQQILASHSPEIMADVPDNCIFRI